MAEHNNEIDEYLGSFLQRGFEGRICRLVRFPRTRGDGDVPTFLQSIG